MSALLDLYNDYLLSSQGQTYATRFSALLDGAIQHDSTARFLSGHNFTSRELWVQVKPPVRAHESKDTWFVFDDTIA